jgi:hypothetical protein
MAIPLPLAQVLSSQAPLQNYQLTKLRVRVTLLPVRLSDKPLDTTSIFFQLNTCGHSPYVKSLVREDESVFYNYCCSSPAQSFSVPSPDGLMTTFYSLRFEIPTTWRARFPYLYPLETRWPSYTPRHGSLFFASYDSQGYGGVMRSRLHTGNMTTLQTVSHL